MLFTPHWFLAHAIWEVPCLPWPCFTRKLYWERHWIEQWVHSLNSHVLEDLWNDYEHARSPEPLIHLKDLLGHELAPEVSDTFQGGNCMRLSALPCGPVCMSPQLLGTCTDGYLPQRSMHGAPMVLSIVRRFILSNHPDHSWSNMLQFFAPSPVGSGPPLHLGENHWAWRPNHSSCSSCSNFKQR